MTPNKTRRTPLLAMALLAIAVGIASVWLVRSTGATTVSEGVNALIDNLQATAERVLDLPLFVLLLAVGLLAACVAGAITRTGSRWRAARIVAAIGITAACSGIAVLADRRIGALQLQILELRAQRSASRPASRETSLVRGSQPTPAIPRLDGGFESRSGLVDAAGTRTKLDAHFRGFRIESKTSESRSEVFEACLDDPRVVAHLAVIDLTNPALEVVVRGNLARKSLTSDFATQNGCSIAINGEAGSSPSPRASLGAWRGHLMDRGEILLEENGETQRPFLVFDLTNRAAFVSEAYADRTLPMGTLNAIWGRWDVLCAGTVPPANTRDRQPRTGMAIDATGKRLYLLVVDGRQPRHSMGFTRTEAGWFLEAFGAHDGMLCDEGGSSSMYVKSLGGIVNIPSDFQGQERPTYTHFGIAIRALTKAKKG